MDLNFDAVVRLTEALLPVLRASAPSSIVNVSSIAGRVARPKGGAYSASSSRWRAGRRPCGGGEAHGVHVGLVLPGFVATEGMPQTSSCEAPRAAGCVHAGQGGGRDPARRTGRPARGGGAAGMGSGAASALRNARARAPHSRLIRARPEGEPLGAIPNCGAAARRRPCPCNQTERLESHGRAAEQTRTTAG